MSLGPGPGPLGCSSSNLLGKRGPLRPMEFSPRPLHIRPGPPSCSCNNNMVKNNFKKSKIFFITEDLSQHDYNFSHMKVGHRPEFFHNTMTCIWVYCWMLKIFFEKMVRGLIFPRHFTITPFWTLNLSSFSNTIISWFACEVSCVAEYVHGICTHRHHHTFTMSNIMSAFGGVLKLFSDDFAFKEAFLYVVQKCMCK